MTQSSTGKKPRPVTIRTRDLTIRASDERILVKNLMLQLNRGEKAAITGRNGVGKSSLLKTLSDEHANHSGDKQLSSHPISVSQILDTATCYRASAYLSDNFTETLIGRELNLLGFDHPTAIDRIDELSHGQRRKLCLLQAKLMNPEILFLDEPTEDLDMTGVLWLGDWLETFLGTALVVTHDAKLLSIFRNFIYVSESGCRGFEGTIEEFENFLAEAEREEEERYSKTMHALSEKEAHVAHIARRKRRKKQYGRVRELGRGTPRSRLNQKRDYAQVKHGRMAAIREARLASVRDWARTSRRSLNVELPFDFRFPHEERFSAHEAMIRVSNLSISINGRAVVADLSLAIRHQRIGVIGSNGSGKTTLLETILTRRHGDQGTVEVDLERVGSIAQSASDWMRAESLSSLLEIECGIGSPDAIRRMLTGYRFPLLLAERPLRSLSPGERTRAALICLFSRRPAVQLLVLDEPTFSLDLLGRAALVSMLSQWAGGLLVASHDALFLQKIRVEKVIGLPAAA